MMWSTRSTTMVDRAVYQRCGGYIVGGERPTHWFSGRVIAETLKLNEFSSSTSHYAVSRLVVCGGKGCSRQLSLRLLGCVRTTEFLEVLSVRKCGSLTLEFHDERSCQKRSLPDSPLLRT